MRGSRLWKWVCWPRVGVSWVHFHGFLSPLTTCVSHQAQHVASRPSGWELIFTPTASQSGSVQSKGGSLSCPTSRQEAAAWDTFRDVLIQSGCCRVVTQVDACFLFHTSVSFSIRSCVSLDRQPARSSGLQENQGHTGSGHEELQSEEDRS